MRVLNAVKRASSVLDGWLVGFDPNVKTYTGSATYEYSVESYSMYREKHTDGFISIDNERLITADGEIFMAADDE